MEVTRLMESVLTADDVAKLIDELVLIEQWLGHTQTELQDLAGTIREELFQILATPEFSGAESRARSAWLLGLKQRLLAMETIEIALAFLPSRRFTERIHRQMKSLFGADVVVKWRYDPELMGGAIITRNGTSVDTSLKKVFDTRSDQQTAYIRKQLQ